MTGDAGMAGQIQNGISGDRCIGAESVVGRLLGTGLGSGVFSVGGSKPGFLGFKAAIGRRESPLKKRTPPPSCRVKKLGDMASKESFWNSSRLMAQQIVGLMEEPW